MKKNTRIILIGGNGFIGKNLVKCLLKNGYTDITVFGRNRTFLDEKNLHFYEGSIINDKDLENIAENYDVIYQMVSSLNPGNSNTDYMVGYEIDFIQSIKLCNYAIKYNRKVIFISSGGTVYGRQEVQPICEEAACNPINHYGTIKRCIELAMMVFNEQAQADFYIARISNPYGPGQNYKNGVGLIDSVIKHAISKETIEIWGDGSIVRDFIFIDDVACMLVALAEYHGNNRIFNLSSGIGTSVNEVVELVREYYPQLNVNYLPGRNVDLPSVVLDNEKIMDIYPNSLTTIRIGIKKYIEWYSKID